MVLNSKLYTYCTVNLAGRRRIKLLMPAKALEAGALVKFSR